jgi:hypothetical protein
MPPPGTAGEGALSRRRAIQASVAAWLVPGTLHAAQEGGRLTFRLEETAGLKRFGYPVTTIVPGITAETRLRLTRDGSAVPAQFRLVTDLTGKRLTILDFNASPGPWESHEYQVEHGPTTAAGSEPRGGMSVNADAATYHVRNGSLLAFRVPATRPGALESVESGRRSYLAQAPTGGLFLYDRAGARHVVGDKDPNRCRSMAARQGPLAIGLESACETSLDAGARLQSHIAMTFPSSKSWVETTWRADDRDGAISAIEYEVGLRLNGEPTLVDLGASSTVYGQLRGTEQMLLRAGHALGSAPGDSEWSVVKGAAPRLSPWAEAPRTGAIPAEGWAHVMDQTSCTAVAVAGFGKATEDVIAVRADGGLRIRRTFAARGVAPAAGPKSLTFWLHFVPMPVQVGAATSPQAMLAPLRVTWR